MKNLKIIITIITGMLIFSACANNTGKDQHIQAVNGFQDLSSFDFGADAAVHLDGEWEFYWNRLLTPDDFSSANPPLKTGNITIPSYWDGYVTGSGPLSGEGFATYRLKVKLKDGGRLYALRIMHMFTAYRLWVNNKIVASNGTVGKDRKSMEPQFLPLVAVFNPQSDEFQIVIQISNYYHINGGFWDSIIIGYEDTIRLQQIKTLFFEIILLGVLLIMSIYYFAIYIMRRQDRTYLYFSLFCFIIAIRVLFLGERLIIVFFPWLDWELCEKISMLTLYLGIVVGNLFLYWLLIEDYSKRMIKICIGLGAIFSIFVVFSFSRYYWYSLNFYYFIVIFWLFYNFFIIIKSSIKKREGAVFLITGIAFIIVTIFLEILYYLRVVNIGNVTPFGLFVFIITQALMLSYRYSRSFTRVEILSREKAGLFTSAIQIISSLILDSSTRLYEKTQNVTKISVLLARKLGYDSEKVEEIKIAALLHDIGMIGVQNITTERSGELSEDEKRIIENHPKRSIDIISDLKELDGVKTIIEQHHESFDGSGFPAGLRDGQIDRGALIIRVVDDFFTLLTIPEYQETDRKVRIIQYIKEQQGHAYDPSVADAFILLINNENILQNVHGKDISASEENGTLIWRMPSALHLESFIVTRVMDKLKKLANIDAGATSSIEFSLGEVVRNAVIHGNKYDTNKSVTVKLRVSDILLMNNEFKKVEISVVDEGEGMDFNVYTHFKQLRTDFSNAIKYIKEQKDRISDEERKGTFTKVIKNFEQFQLKYFFDFNTFMQRKGAYLSGGLGLIYVLRMFDNVEFRKITDEHRVCGMEIIMEKTFPV
jgi:putative nucleotidyltransferase with HDIG domain